MIMIGEILFSFNEKVIDSRTICSSLGLKLGNGSGCSVNILL